MNAPVVDVVVAAVVVDVTEKIVQQRQVRKLKSQMHSVSLNHHANLKSQMKIVVSVHSVVNVKIGMHLQQRKHYSFQ
jgi:hypothetical protein